MVSRDRSLAPDFMRDNLKQYGGGMRAAAQVLRSGPKTACAVIPLLIRHRSSPSSSHSIRRSPSFTVYWPSTFCLLPRPLSPRPQYISSGSHSRCCSVVLWKLAPRFGVNLGAGGGVAARDLLPSPRGCAKPGTPAQAGGTVTSPQCGEQG